MLYLRHSWKEGTLVLKELVLCPQMFYYYNYAQATENGRARNPAHIMGRGIERTKIFRNNEDRDDFLRRLGVLCQEGYLIVYAWALLSNHFHILARTGRQPLSGNMRKLLTGYVVNFNKRHKRSGHLFQNRYKSIVCEDDPYLLELTRYIHLNPLRAGLVEDLDKLAMYPWSGHSVLMGNIVRDWQESDAILAYYGGEREQSRNEYESFVRAGIVHGRRPELVGGGLIRSHGDWSQVVSFRRKGESVCSDARVLGGSDFVDKILLEAETKERETLRLASGKIDLPTLLQKIAHNEKINASSIISGVRMRNVVRARKLFCQVAVGKLGYSGAEAARFLRISTSAVNRLARSDELSECKHYVT